MNIFMNIFSMDTISFEFIWDSQISCAFNYCSWFYVPLPNFYGELEEWIFFHDIFEFIIKYNKSFTNIKIFHYLKFALKGKTALKLLFNVNWITIILAYRNYEDTNEFIDYHGYDIHGLFLILLNLANELRQLIDNKIWSLKLQNNCQYNFLDTCLRNKRRVNDRRAKDVGKTHIRIKT